MRFTGRLIEKDAPFEFYDDYIPLYGCHHFSIPFRNDEAQKEEIEDLAQHAHGCMCLFLVAELHE